ncbi:RNA polymerase Rpb4 [Candidatus Bilamarchaeum dharawalense]|uniref:RNA polymerase Rpb4 n=1 Tax=Candidatus Bilamarchaeum dharawalense TaxID=2885759 RepID=A0A5E4LR08_9ARCH|nr:RNA polymerase Rpb4 [Candidatus Bilamarchaeum dharawalense]
MEIKSSKPVSLSEAKTILSKRKGDGELGYEQSQALENTERFAIAEEDKAKKIIENLRKHEKISADLAVKIVDIRPATSATLRAILVKDRVEMSDEEVEKILKELA